MLLNGLSRGKGAVRSASFRTEPVPCERGEDTDDVGAIARWGLCQPMISVKLAKKLKAAGFRDVVLYEETKTVIAPTLSELIEACPKVIDGHSFHLTWTSVLGKGDKWVAYYDDGGASIGIEGYGDVSDEAVANLWLELTRDLVQNPPAGITKDVQASSGGRLRPRPTKAGGQGRSFALGASKEFSTPSCTPLKNSAGPFHSTPTISLG